MAEIKLVKICDICRLEKGVTGLASAIPGDYPLVATSAERKNSKTYQFDAKAVCIPLVSSTGHGKRSLNYVHYQEGRFALGSILAALIPKDEGILSARYLHAYLQKNKDRVLVPLMKGAANVSLSVTAISNIEIPLPSIQRQQAILNKIDSISNEHRYFLAELDAQVDLFEKLRKAILQEAIEGKLTAGWRKQNQELISGDNHASKLLEKIKEVRDRLVKEGKIRKQEPLPLIKLEEIPYGLPRGWEWARLGSAGETNIGLTYSPSDISDVGTPVLRSNNVQNGKLDLSDLVRVRKEIKSSVMVKEGDLLICARNGSKALVGKTAQIIGLREEMAFGAFMAIFRSRINDYVLYFINSPLFRKMISKVNTMTINQITQNNLKTTIFPLPPLAEQKIIVERVGKLMAMVDELEKQATERKNQSEMLMQSVLREAFAG